VKVQSLAEAPQSFIYQPLASGHQSLLRMVVRTPGSPQRAVAALRDTVRAMDPAVGVFEARTMSENFGVMIYPYRLAAGLGGAFGILALLLAAVGLYGVLGCGVNERLRELAIRLALGAPSHAIVRAAGAETGRAVAAGLLLGMAMALVTGSLMADVLFGISPFDAVAMFVTSPNTLAIHPSLPANDLKEFIALAKSKPGDIQYASGGAGGSQHLGMELFKLTARVDLLHVPFRGAGPATIDVIAGNTKATIATASSVAGHIRSGKLRGLAISMDQRIKALPNVPTFGEAGLPEYKGGNWIGFSVPAGTPRPIIELLHKEISAIQDMPEVQEQLENRGAFVEKMTVAQFGEFVRSEISKWGRVVKEAGIKPQ